MAKRNGQDRAFWESGNMNNATYAQYYRRLTELSISMFKWENLPETVDPRFMELALFSQGQAVFFEDEEMGFLCLQNLSQGDFDVYRVPKRRRAFAANGYQVELNESNSVIIYNNYLRTGSMLDVNMFAARLTEIDRTIDVNVKAQKTPILISCDENERLSMKNLYMQYDGNQPYIFGTNDMRGDTVKVLKTDAPFVARNLYDLKVQYWNEALTYLGISNTNIQKKERLISDEVTRAMGATIASRYSRLNARREAVEKINKMFGLNIEVSYREDYRELDNEIMLPADSEDGDVTIVAGNAQAQRTFVEV